MVEEGASGLEFGSVSCFGKRIPLFPHYGLLTRALRLQIVLKLGEMDDFIIWLIYISPLVGAIFS